MLVSRMTLVIPLYHCPLLYGMVASSLGHVVPLRWQIASSSLVVVVVVVVVVVIVVAY